jgi:hypothetical protein
MKIFGFSDEEIRKPHGNKRTPNLPPRRGRQATSWPARWDR